MSKVHVDVQALGEQLLAVLCCTESLCILLNLLPCLAVSEVHGEVQALEEQLRAVVCCTVPLCIELNPLVCFVLQRLKYMERCKP